MTEAALFEVERREMVEQQLLRRGIRDKRVLDAMLSVPRHEFVPPAFLGMAYDDRPVPIGASETISQPYIVAAMTEAAQVEPGDTALEVGTGTGYQAAILAYLGAKVYTIERNSRHAEVARARLARLGYTDIEVIWADGSKGYPAAAPYQVILVTAAAPDVPRTLLDQLDEGGRMVIPVGNRFQQNLHLILKERGETLTRVLDACQFVPLLGQYGWPQGTE
jgi:protein-L-isoaspartate(D-aspartate) O-methyltransferase